LITIMYLIISLFLTLSLSLSLSLSLLLLIVCSLSQAFSLSLILSLYFLPQSDMSHRLKLLLVKEAETSLVLPFDLHPVYLHALTLFTTKEIIPYPFQGQEVFEAHACLSRHTVVDVSAPPATATTIANTVRKFHAMLSHVKLFLGVIFKAMVQSK
jgi:hypothetical protein